MQPVLTEKFDSELDVLYTEAVEYYEMGKYDEFVLEARAAPNTSFLKDLDYKYRKTASPARQVARAYNITTREFGGILRSLFNAISSAISFIVSVFNTIIEKASNISKFIKNIPNEIKNKLRGYIKLYLNFDDLNFLHSELYPDIKKFVEITEGMSKGSGWDSILEMNEDLKGSGQLRKIVDKLDINFVKTNIDFSQPGNREVYFGNEMFKFTDVKGNKCSGNYYDSLAALIIKLKNLTPQLHSVRKAFHEKTIRLEATGSLNKVRELDRNKIHHTVAYIAKVYKNLMTFIKCARHDLGTMKGAMDKINREIDK